MKNKSADSMGFQFIVVLAVVVAFAIIYLVWLKDFRTFGGKLSDYEICRFSNIENAKLKLKISNQVISERKGNRCVTEYINVPKGKELDTIAKKMAGCWDQYLEGKEELFDTESGTYCAFCSVLVFENKKQIAGLTDYLFTQEASYVTDVKQSNKRYNHYMPQTIVTNDVYREVENSHLKDLDIIDTAKSQAIIFMMGKAVNPGSLTGISSVKSGAVGGAIGAVAGGAVIGGLLIKTGVGLCLTGLGCWAGAFLVTVGGAVGGFAGGTTGYMIGSTNNPNRQSYILLWPYTKEDLDKLKCTKLEGKDNLEIKK